MYGHQRFSFIRHLVLAGLYLFITACGSSGSDGGNSNNVGSVSSSNGDYQISLNIGLLTFTAHQNGSQPDDQFVSVSYKGDGVIVGYPQVDPGWLGISVEGNQFANPLSMRFSITRTDLSPGTYNATVRFLTGNLAGTDGTYVDLSVTYVVQAPQDSTTPVPTPAPTPVPVPGSISLNKSAVDFSYVPGRTTNTTQSVVSVSSTTAWTASASASWIGLSTTSGSGSNDVTVSVNADGMLAGAYNGTVVFTQTSTGKEVTLGVNLSVTDGAIVLSTQTASFSGTNGKAISPQDVVVTLDGGGGANWTASSNQPWLTLNGGTTPVTAGSATTLQLGIDAQSTKLASGSYNGLVTITSTFNGTEHSATVSVKLNLTPMTLTVSTSSMYFSAINGATIPVQSRSVSLNTDIYDHPWTATASEPWLKVNGANVASGMNSGTLDVSIDASTLASGSYSATLAVDAQVNGDVIHKSIPVSLILTKPTITLSTSTSSLSFSGVNGSPINDKAVYISLNTGTSSHNWTAVIDDGGGPGSDWLTLGALSGAASSTPSSFNVGIDASLLSSGVYSGVVTITAQVNGDTLTKTLPVNLTLTKASFSLSQSSLSFSAVNGNVIDAKPVAISLNTGTNAYAWTAEINDGGDPGSDWLTLDTSFGNASATPGNIHAGIDASLLSSGAYSGSITLTAQVHGDTVTAEIPVSLALTLPSITLSTSNLLFKGVNGNVFDSQTIDFSINTGSVNHPWSAKLVSDKGAGDPWLLTSDSLIGDVSSTLSSLTFDVDSTTMVGNVYSGNVTVTVIVNGDTLTKTVPVSLRLEPHHLFVPDIGVAFSSFPSETSVLTKTVTVSENGGKATSWTTSKSADWLSVTASGTTDGNLIMTANPAGLSTDVIHYADVVVSSSDPTIENTQTIRVGFWVGSTDPAATNSLTLTYKEAVADPVRPYVYLNNNGTDIDIYNIYTATLVNTITSVGGVLGDMEVSSDGAMLYVADDTSGVRNIVPVNLDTLAVGTPWSGSSYKTTPTHMTYARPGGRAVIFADNGYIYDAFTGDTSLGALNMSFYYDYYYLASSLYGNRVCGINSGLSPYTGKCFTLTYSDLEGGILGRTANGQFSVGSNGADVAVSDDGSRVYAASGSPYSFAVFDGTTMAYLELLPGGAYPNAVEIGSNGFLFGGVSSLYGPKDVWVYNSDGVEQFSGYVSGYADNILNRQLVVSGDAKRMIILTSDPKVVFLTAP